MHAATISKVAEHSCNNVPTKYCYELQRYAFESSYRETAAYFVSYLAGNIAEAMHAVKS